MESGRRGTRGMIPLLVLQAASEYYRLESKPPITAALVAANTLIYLRPGVLDRFLPTINEVWFNSNLILKQRSLKRFFLSAFYHLGEPHLVYNMMSLLWKGIRLETSMGSLRFASMVAVLLGLSQGITLLLAKSLLLFFDYGTAYYHEYAVGFSGVLFAMKVVLNSQSDSYTNVYGLMVPSQHAAWAELILIQLLVPGVSFLGHLGGILAGIVYLRLRDLYRGPNPLTAIATRFARFLRWPLRFLPGFRRTSGSGSRTYTSGVWRCRACTFDNSGWLSFCEVCGTSRSDDGLTSIQPSSFELPLEELRHRRVQRYHR